MKKIIQIAASVFLFGLVIQPAKAAFTSLYIFGDGTSTTTNDTLGSPEYYYGGRFCNGRVWVEVLAQRLGLGTSPLTNDWSYYGDYSTSLLVNITNFPTPPNVKNALFVVWVSDADFVNDLATVYGSSYNTNATNWSLAIGQSITNHQIAINNLINKGVRTLIMPDAVDITEVPQYNGLAKSRPQDRIFIRQQIINFNAAFTALLKQEQASQPGLTIYEPDFFGMLDNMQTNAGAYGLTNFQVGGINEPALGYAANVATNGPGTNFVFWDALNPTAKVQEIMADTALPLIAQPQIASLTVLDSSTTSNSTNQLNVINMPVGLNGFVDGSTNLGAANMTWTTVTNISSTSVAQSLFVYAPPLPPVNLPSGYGSINPGNPGGGAGANNGVTNTFSGEIQTYRLRFPLAWSWP